MRIENGDLLTLGGGETHLVIDNILFEDKKYIFTNEFKGEEPTQQYAIYEVSEEGLSLITDETKMQILFPMFNNNVKKILQEVKNERFNIE